MHDIPEALLIDWAGTITIPLGEMVQSAAVKLGFSDDDLAKAFGGLAEYLVADDSPFHRAERGELDDDDLREFLETKSPGAGRLFDPTGPAFFDGADRPEMIELLGQLRDADVMVVMATNNFVSAQNLLAERYLDSGLVSAIVNSALIGHRKPEPDFYLVALEAVGVEAHEVLFVDDNARNVDAAVELGMPSVLMGPDAGPTIESIRTAFRI